MQLRDQYMALTCNISAKTCGVGLRRVQKIASGEKPKWD